MGAASVLVAQVRDDNISLHGSLLPTKSIGGRAGGVHVKDPKGDEAGNDTRVIDGLALGEVGAGLPPAVAGAGCQSGKPTLKMAMPSSTPLLGTMQQGKLG